MDLHSASRLARIGGLALLAAAAIWPAMAEDAASGQSLHAKTSHGDEAGWVVAADDEDEPAETGTGDATETRDEPSAAVGGEEAWRESWSGVELAGSIMSLYQGFGIAPFGPLSDSGWRARAIGGYARFPLTCKSASGRREVSCTGQGAFAEALLGYQHGFGQLTVKGWLGVAGSGHLDPSLADTAYATSLGAKAAAEFWLNLGDQAWSALDLAAATRTHYPTLGHAWNWRLRLGYRWWPQLSLGMEAAGHGKTERIDEVLQEKTVVRFGLLARFEWPEGEVSATAGRSLTTSTEPGSRGSQPYATLNWLTRF